MKNDRRSIIVLLIEIVAIIWLHSARITPDKHESKSQIVKTTKPFNFYYLTPSHFILTSQIKK